MKEKILITGASGLIGKALVKQLQDANYTVVQLSRKAKHSEGIYKWDYTRGYLEKKALEGVNHIIHLAGAGIVDKPWTIKRKKELRDSRIETLGLLLEKVRELSIPLKTLVSTSGINYYGTSTSEYIYTEDDAPANDFIGNLCQEWEEQAFSFTPLCRVVCLRLGIVLAKNGGALPKMALPHRFGLGAPLGSGKQYMPWVSALDAVNCMQFAIQETKIAGVFNLVSGEDCTNYTFNKTLAYVTKVTFFMPAIPKFVLRLVLGKRANLITEGSRISNAKLLQSGFVVADVNLEITLKRIYSNNF